MFKNASIQEIARVWQKTVKVKPSDERAIKKANIKKELDKIKRTYNH